MIRLEALTRTFQVGDQLVRALDDVNLTIEAGEYLSIMGPSGSGKSTLLNVLGLLDTPTSGAYWLDGVNTSTMPDDQLAATRQRQIGFVFQSFHLVPRMTSPRERGAADAAGRHAAGRAPRAGPARAAKAWRCSSARITARRSSPAASASASRSHARSSCSRSCCWPTSPPAISTAPRAPRSCASWRR